MTLTLAQITDTHLLAAPTARLVLFSHIHLDFQRVSPALKAL
ncbi:MAG: hypothetical protein ACFCVB_05440 [Nodosilinea sp.]